MEENHFTSEKKRAGQSSGDQKGRGQISQGPKLRGALKGYNKVFSRNINNHSFKASFFLSQFSEPLSVGAQKKLFVIG